MNFQMLSVSMGCNLMMICLLSICSISHAQTVKSDAVLLDKPDGMKLSLVSANSNIRILKRHGFWAQIEATSKTGWIRLNQLTFGGVSGVTALDTGRSGAGNIVSTSVARGLSAKDLINGKADNSAVSKIESWSPNPASIDKFCSEGGVTPVNLSISLKTPALVKPLRKRDKVNSDEE
jgi:hypothetical protein